jgi:hypothetical protein
MTEDREHDERVKFLKEQIEGLTRINEQLEEVLREVRDEKNIHSITVY